MENLEARITRDALGWLVLIFGLAWLAASIFPDFASGIAAWGETDETSGYLQGVLGRSLRIPLQGVLLAALVAVPLHALWTLMVRRGDEAALAYDQFGIWAQTLLTSFGFLGTIIGISQAVSGLEAAMMAGEPGGLIDGLSTAFDTTFLGLTGAIFVMILRKGARLRSRM